MTSRERKLVAPGSGLFVAIVSLVVAFTALGYNSWRNEQSEFNRNIRRAGFEMLVHVAALQRVTYLAHFEQDLDGGNPRNGWVEVLVLRDLAVLMPESITRHAEELHTAWNDNWMGLGKSDLSVAAIDQTIDKLRKNVVAELEALD